MSDTTRVAFLKGINVGGHNVKMEDLRSQFELLGLDAVRTFIASGNVIFDSGGEAGGYLERRIEEHLEKALGYAVPTFIRTAVELGDIAGFDPFTDESSADTDSVFVGFLRGPVDDSVAKTIELMSNPRDLLHIEGTELYWLIHGNFLDSSYSAPKIEKALGSPMTIRNLTTVSRLVSKLHG